MAEGDYDIIIAGGGVSGLSSGILLLRNDPDLKVLILEKNHYAGGYCTSYERGGYTFETISLIPDVRDIIEFMGLDLELRPYQGTLMRRKVVRGKMEKEYRIPAGPDAFAYYMGEQFPEDTLRFSKWMQHARKLFHQVGQVHTNPRILDSLLTPARAPGVVLNLGKSFASYLDRHGLKDPALREVMETFSSFSGVPPNRASAILTVGAMLSALQYSARPAASFSSFPEAMVKRFTELGGELRTDARIESFLCADGRIQGVRMAMGAGEIRSERVISTLDPIMAMKTMVGKEHLPPAYIKRLDRIQMSHSGFHVNLGLDEAFDLKGLDLDYPYNLVSTGLGTPAVLYDAFLGGDHAFSEECFQVGVISPSLALGGKPSLTLTAAPFAAAKWIFWREHDYAKYRREKKKIADLLVGIAEQYFIPGLRQAIRVMDINSPATYARYSGSPTGSIYDMAATVEQFGPSRLPMQTPVEGLYQPKFSHGIYGAMMNGVQVCDQLMGRSFNGGRSLFSPRAGS